MYSMALGTEHAALIQKIWLLFQALLFAQYCTMLQASIFTSWHQCLLSTNGEIEMTSYQ